MNRLYFSVKKPFVHVLAFVAWVERSVCSIQKFTKFWVNEFEMRPLSPIEKKLNFFFLRFFTCDSGMYIQMKTADRTGHTSGSIGATCTYVHMCRAAEICLKNYFTFGKVGLGFKCTEVQKFADRKTRNLYFLNNKWHPERFFSIVVLRNTFWNFDFSVSEKSFRLSHFESEVEKVLNLDFHNN
jgi:hypothetical protein